MSEIDDLSFFGLDEYSSHEVLRAKYLTMLKKYHPDVFSGEMSSAQNIAADINARYERLKNFTFKINEKQEPSKVDDSASERVKQNVNYRQVEHSALNKEQKIEENPVLRKVAQIKSERDLVDKKSIKLEHRIKNTLLVLGIMIVLIIIILIAI